MLPIFRESKGSHHAVVSNLTSPPAETSRTWYTDAKTEIAALHLNKHKLSFHNSLFFYHLYAESVIVRLWNVNNTIYPIQSLVVNNQDD